MAGGGKGAATNAPTNPYMQASQGLQGAYNTVGGALAANSNANPNAYTYNPATATAAQAGPGATYNASLQGQAPSLASLMDRYTNPYEDAVVGRTTDNMLRSLQATQQNNAAAANAAGAFGGSRHGLVEAQTNAETMRNIGDITAQLRQAGFDTAAGLAGQDVANILGVRSQNQAAENAARQFGAGTAQDVNLTNAGYRQQAELANQAAKNQAGQFNASQRYGVDQDRFTNAITGANTLGNLSQASYGIGASIADQQQQTGALSQQLLQSLLTSGQGMYEQYMSQPERLLQLRLASLGMNPLSNATTTTATSTNNPGKGGLVGNLIGAAGNMFQFAPIQLSSRRFKHSIVPTGKVMVTDDGNKVRQVSFYYTEGHGDPNVQFLGIIAEELPKDDSAVIRDTAGWAVAVDYSKVREA